MIGICFSQTWRGWSLISSTYVWFPRGFRCIRSSEELKESDATHSVFSEKRRVPIRETLFSYLLRPSRRKRRLSTLRCFIRKNRKFHYYLGVWEIVRKKN